VKTVIENPNQALTDQKQRIRSLILDYYQSAPFPFEPTEADFRTWLKTLTKTEQDLYQWMGMDTCRHMLDFRRFYFRQRGHRLESYLASHLSIAEFKVWLSME